MFKNGSETRPRKASSRRIDCAFLVRRTAKPARSADIRCTSFSSSEKLHAAPLIAASWAFPRIPENSSVATRFERLVNKHVVLVPTTFVGSVNDRIKSLRTLCPASLSATSASAASFASLDGSTDLRREAEDRVRKSSPPPLLVFVLENKFSSIAWCVDQKNCCESSSNLSMSISAEFLATRMQTRLTSAELNGGSMSFVDVSIDTEREDMRKASSAAAACIAASSPPSSSGGVARTIVAKSRAHVVLSDFDTSSDACTIRLRRWTPAHVNSMTDCGVTSSASVASSSPDAGTSVSAAFSFASARAPRKWSNAVSSKCASTDSRLAILRHSEFASTPLGRGRLRAEEAEEAEEEEEEEEEEEAAAEAASMSRCPPPWGSEAGRGAWIAAGGGGERGEGEGEVGGRKSAVYFKVPANRLIPRHGPSILSLPLSFSLSPFLFLSPRLLLLASPSPLLPHPHTHPPGHTQTLCLSFSLSPHFPPSVPRAHARWQRRRGRGGGLPPRLFARRVSRKGVVSRGRSLLVTAPE